MTVWTVSCLYKVKLLAKQTKILLQNLPMGLKTLMFLVVKLVCLLVGKVLNVKLLISNAQDLYYQFTERPVDWLYWES